MLLGEKGNREDQGQGSKGRNGGEIETHRETTKGVRKANRVIKLECVKKQEGREGKASEEIERCRD